MMDGHVIVMKVGTFLQLFLFSLSFNALPLSFSLLLILFKVSLSLTRGRDYWTILIKILLFGFSSDDSSSHVIIVILLKREKGKLVSNGSINEKREEEGSKSAKVIAICIFIKYRKLSLNFAINSNHISIRSTKSYLYFKNLTFYKQNTFSFQINHDLCS